MPLSILRIFISYCSDTDSLVELARNIISENNPRWEKSHHMTVRVLTFRDIMSTYHKRGTQKYINDAILGKYDAYLGLMWTRFGRPTERFGSGTEEEYSEAVDNFLRLGRPEYVLFGFSDEKIRPSKIDVEQLAGVFDFRKRISINQLFFEWSDRKGFRDSVIRNMDEMVLGASKDPGRFVIGGTRYS